MKVNSLLNHICCTCEDYNTQPVLCLSSKKTERNLLWQKPKMTKSVEVSNINWNYYCVPLGLNCRHRAHNLFNKRNVFIYLSLESDLAWYFHMFTECSQQWKEFLVAEFKSVEQLHGNNEKSGSC